MNEIENKKIKRIMNEYLEVEVAPRQLELYKDCCQAFGWTIINRNSGIGKVTMRLQRERKIKNRDALGALQRNCEAAFQSIEDLENSKTTKATAVSIVVGITGTIFMTCAVFSYLSGSIGAHILFAIPGFIGWGIPYFLYKSIKHKSIAKIEPMITHNYDVIYDACEKAMQLTNY